MARESDKERLFRQEVNLAHQLYTSSTRGEVAKIGLGLPADVRGLVVVDVGSGGSGLAAILLKGGAIVRAVDPIYEHPDEIDVLIDRANQKVFQKVSLNVLNTVRAGVLKGAQEFRESYKEQPEVYLPGYASNIPLEDGFADYVVSLHAISDLAAVPRVLKAALAESVRVVKSGGIVIISPWHTPLSISGQQAYIRQHSQMVEKLNRMGLRSVEVKRPANGSPFALRIIK